MVFEQLFIEHVLAVDFEQFGLGDVSAYPFEHPAKPIDLAVCKRKFVLERLDVRSLESHYNTSIQSYLTLYSITKGRKDLLNNSQIKDLSYTYQYLSRLSSPISRWCFSLITSRAFLSLPFLT